MEENFGIRRMLQIQDELQEKYKGKWDPIGPDAAKDKFMWAVGEMGEVIEIFKKRGVGAVMQEPEVRCHFIEEMVDVYMYLADVLNCTGVTPEEFAQAYESKHAYNMRRDYAKGSRDMFKPAAEEN
ncbi:MAG: nucleotide pyrophosphohydrolase [Eubacteriales bacterium]|nr:nucleotide pyrophosphohydrolase [Eubacteriales bacterium]